MLSTPADICNVALQRAGERQLIDSLDEDSAAAQACAVAYPHERDVLLAAFPWGFATRRAALAELAGQAPTGWAYAYALPIDFLAVQALANGRLGEEPARYLDSPWLRTLDARDYGSLLDIRAPYRLEAGDAGAVLLTGQPEAELVYTARVEAVALWPALFADALAWRLASQLALALSGKRDVAAALEQQHLVAVVRAQAYDARQREGERQPPESEFVRVR